MTGKQMPAKLRAIVAHFDGDQEKAAMNMLISQHRLKRIMLMRHEANRTEKQRATTLLNDLDASAEILRKEPTPCDQNSPNQDQPQPPSKSASSTD